MIGPAVAIVACGTSVSPQIAGRYQQITNPPAVLCLATGLNTTPEPGCGLMILDTQTGTIFIQRGSDWLERNPHTGLNSVHDFKWSGGS